MDLNNFPPKPPPFLLPPDTPLEAVFGGGAPPVFSFAGLQSDLSQEGIYRYGDTSSQEFKTFLTPKTSSSPGPGGLSLVPSNDKIYFSSLKLTSRIFGGIPSSCSLGLLGSTEEYGTTISRRWSITPLLFPPSYLTFFPFSFFFSFRSTSS